MLENHSGAAKKLRYYEYWDVGRRPITINWVVSGSTFQLAPETARAQRDAENGMFDESVSYDPAARLLGLRRTYTGTDARPAADAPSPVDYYPGDPFLAEVVGTPSDVYTDQAGFFGQGGVAAPDAVVGRTPGQGADGGVLGKTANGLGQPRAFVVRSDITLGAGESKTLRFAYGYAAVGQPFAIDKKWRDPAYDARADYTKALEPRLFYFGADRDPFLHREMAWHSYQLETSIGRRDYFEGHVVPQGSAYLYLHGADGAARDLALFAVPLVYTDPELAKAELELMMRTPVPVRRALLLRLPGQRHARRRGRAQRPERPRHLLRLGARRVPGRHGRPRVPRRAAAVLAARHRPRRQRLRSPRPRAPPPARRRGHRRARAIRLQSGDWSDGITLEAPDHALAVQKGESVPNTQMAVAVFPRIADLVEPRDAALAAELRTAVQGLPHGPGRHVERQVLLPGVLRRQQAGLRKHHQPRVTDLGAHRRHASTRLATGRSSSTTSKSSWTTPPPPAPRSRPAARCGPPSARRSPGATR